MDCLLVALSWARVWPGQELSYLSLARRLSAWLSGQPSQALKPVDDPTTTLHRTRNLAWRSKSRWIMALGVGNPNPEARRMLNR